MYTAVAQQQANFHYNYDTANKCTLHIRCNIQLYATTSLRFEQKLYYRGYLGFTPRNIPPSSIHRKPIRLVFRAIRVCGFYYIIDTIIIEFPIPASPIVAVST